MNETQQQQIIDLCIVYWFGTGSKNVQWNAATSSHQNELKMIVPFFSLWGSANTATLKKVVVCDALMLNLLIMKWCISASFPTIIIKNALEEKMIFTYSSSLPPSSHTHFFDYLLATLQGDCSTADYFVVVVFVAKGEKITSSAVGYYNNHNDDDNILLLLLLWFEFLDGCSTIQLWIVLLFCWFFFHKWDVALQEDRMCKWNINAIMMIALTYDYYYPQHHYLSQTPRYIVRYGLRWDKDLVFRRMISIILMNKWEWQILFEKGMKKAPEFNIVKMLQAAENKCCGLC